MLCKPMTKARRKAGLYGHQSILTRTDGTPMLVYAAAWESHVGTPFLEVVGLRSGAYSSLG